MVAFNEQAGSPSFNIRKDGVGAVRTGLIAWADIDAFMTEVFPASFSAGNQSINYLGSAFPGRALLRADSLEIRPFGSRITGVSADEDFASLASYEKAICVIQYATTAAQDQDGGDTGGDTQDPVPLLSHRWSIGGEFLTLPNTSFVWKTDNEPLATDIEVGLFVPTIEHEITWPSVIAPPFRAIRNCVGKVNEEHLCFMTGKVESETLLFLGAELDREVTTGGERAWRMVYRFSEKRVVSGDSDDASQTPPITYGGWNYYYREDEAGFWRVNNIDLNEGGPYATADFSTLFQSETPEECEVN